MEEIDEKKHYYIELTGGLCDNIRIYVLKFYNPKLKITFVTDDLRKYEIGQKSNNLLKFRCKDIISKKDVPESEKIYLVSTQRKNLNVPGFTLGYSVMRKNRNNLRKLLLNPVVSYSSISTKIVNEYIKRTLDYLLIGIRWRYPYSIRNHFFLYSCKELIEKIESNLRSFKNVILMFDDWRYIKVFKMMFYDLLKNKTIISLSNIGANDVHDLMYIGYNCVHCNRHKRNKRNFVHNFSGLYLLIDIITN